MTTSDDIRVGTILDDRYELLSQLGRGGMGCVYRAEHRAIRKPVAIKLLAPIARNCTDVDRARFEREAYATGMLDHPNCVAVTDFGKLDDGALYLVMELLEGRPLSEVIRSDGPMQPARALRIVRHVLEGLAHAHDLGIVHRDLKPPNVILTEHLGDSEFAKVLDFGLAKLQGEALDAEGGEKLTAAGFTFGTPHYMSPEQIFGNPVDHRTDLYAASVLLFELVTGALPFDGPDMRGILLAHGTKVVPRIHEVAPEIDVPIEIELLIRQGMAKDPRDRVQDARDYVRRIDACLAALDDAGAGDAARPPSPPRAPEPGAAERPSAHHHTTVALPPGHVAELASRAAPASSSAPRPVLPQAAVHAAPARRPGMRRAGAGALGALATAGLAFAIALPASQPTVAAGPSGAGAAPAATNSHAPGSDRLRDAEALRPPTPTAPRESRVAPGLEAEIVRAMRSPHRQAVRQLETLEASHPDSAAVAFSLGRLYYARPWPSQAIKAYRRAIARDPGYRDNPIIIAHAIAMLSSRSSRGAAERLLAREIGEPALPQLDAAARDRSSKTIRDRAARIARAIRGR